MYRNAWKNIATTYNHMHPQTTTYQPHENRIQIAQQTHILSAQKRIETHANVWKRMETHEKKA